MYIWVQVMQVRNDTFIRKHCCVRGKDRERLYSSTRVNGARFHDKAKDREFLSMTERVPTVFQ